MKDRFKFRVYFKGSEYAEAGYEDLTREDVIYSLRSDGQIIRDVVYECQQEDREGSPCHLPYTPLNELYDVQFCTGLKDKNGKLIYEGDVVKIDNELNCIAQFHKNYDIEYGRLEFILIGGHPKCPTVYIPPVAHESEIIGNIYDNPELLSNA